MTESYTCAWCGATPYNPSDAAKHYCGRCHQFEEFRVIEDEQIKQFVAERNEMLRSLDVEKFNAFWKKWNGDKVPAGGWADPIEVPLIMMHQSRLAVEAMTAEEKAISKKWLKDRGYGFGRYHVEPI
jgi:hypothetical protein